MTSNSPAPATSLFFSAYHPSALSAGQRHPLLVYSHLQGALDAISTDAGQVLGMVAANYHQPGADTDGRLPPGTEIVIVPQADGLTFEPPEARLTWSGSWQRADFVMEATGDHVGQMIEGSVACYCGPLLIAEMRLPVMVPDGEDEPSSAPVPRQIQTTEMYRTIYPSFSHADSALVEAIAAAGETLGLDDLGETLALKLGERWSDELLRKIEAADIFQLFWSESSSRSDFVEQEWRHALPLANQKDPTFIRPVYWKRPLPPVPPALYHRRFALIDLPKWISSQKPPTKSAPKTNDPAGSRPGAAARQQRPRSEALDRLTISTFVTHDPEDPASARLKARTRIDLNGDVEVYLPAGADDKDTLEVHTATVREALRARLALLQSKDDEGLT